MEKRYETRSGDLFVRSWARVRRVSLDRRSSAGETKNSNRLLSFLLKYNILYDHQFGFIPGKNTTTHAILSLVDCLINSFEDNN